jgi:hypothetical protein
MCEEALAQMKLDTDGVIYYGSMKMVFEPGEWPVLKTVMFERKREQSIDDIKKSMVIVNGRYEFAKPKKTVV